MPTLVMTNRRRRCNGNSNASYIYKYALALGDLLGAGARLVSLARESHKQKSTEKLIRPLNLEFKEQLSAPRWAARCYMTPQGPRASASAQGFDARS